MSLLDDAKDKMKDMGDKAQEKRQEMMGKIDSSNDQQDETSDSE